MSLRTFHMMFLLLAIMGADLFGGWALHHWMHRGDPLILVLGVISFVGGLGLAGYALWFSTRLQRNLP